MTRPAPWWLGWALVAGLAAVFVGERVVPGVALARAVFSGLGALVVLACVIWRAASRRAAGPESRRVEGWLVLAYAGCALALAGYMASSDDGLRRLGMDFADARSRERWQVMAQVLATILLAISLGPTLGAQLALGRHRQARADAAGVEAFRVLETATSGLAVALAGALLFVVGYVASEHDEALDLSYFKTATPGASTQAMLSRLDEPLRVLLFFPEPNPVKDEVLAYFRELADATDRVAIEEHDRLAAPVLAEKHGVVDDGAIILLRGDQEARLQVGASLAESRAVLRGLDQRFQTALLPILRPRRFVYLTTGHGEINDSLAAPGARSSLGGTSVLTQLVSRLGYEELPLGLSRGLGNEVPADAAVVAVLGPRRPFLAEEMAALERYVARGGSLLLALDPEGDFRMDGLEARLGVRFVDVQLANEEQHMQQRGDDSDRRLIVTDRFSSHEAVTTLARAGGGTAVLFVGPGRIEQAEGSAASPVFVVSALPSTFADATRDYRFDPGSETQSAFGLVAAVETARERDAAPDTAGAGAAAALGVARPDAAPIGGRALVFASSSPFTDAVLVSLGNNAALVADGLRWLAREESISGAVETEEDLPIVHTQAEDVVWFHATILGAPALVLGVGLLGVLRRRRRRVDA